MLLKFINRVGRFNLSAAQKFPSTLKWHDNTLLLKRLLSGRSGPTQSRTQKLKKVSTLYYVTAAGVLCVGFSYAAVPLYRMFCQAYSYGGTTGAQHDGSLVEGMEKVSDRIIKIQFNADIGASMRWNFKPQQYEIKVAIQ